MKCPICGFENTRGVRFCGYCGEELPPPPPDYSPQNSEHPSEIAWPYDAPTWLGNYWKILVVVVVIIVLIGVMAALNAGIARSGPHLKITEWTPLSMGTFIGFGVGVSNTGDKSGSATIHCSVAYDGGDSYTGTQAINLGPSQSNVYSVIVEIPYSHFLDQSGEYSCTLS